MGKITVPASARNEGVVMKRSITGAGHALSLALALLACDRSPEQHLLQAQERLAKHEYPAAVVELKSALQQQPENGDARLLLGQAFVAIAAYPDAVTELLKARELGVANDQVHGCAAASATCRPHSLLVSSHHQRPARKSSPTAIARVHGAQPMLGKNWSCSAL
jgi:thioredoxin-like negative regulator of GroEL